jgi:hypothetical protein
MNKNSLIEKGYFGKELPPCFTTVEYSKHFEAIITEVANKSPNEISRIFTQIDSDTTIGDKEEAKKKAKKAFQNTLKASSCVEYSIPKIGYSRQLISIPNPLQQGRLVLKIHENITKFVEVYDKSRISTTKPREETNTEQGKRAITHDSYSLFKEKGIINSFDKIYLLKADISKYYASIYTHVIPWAFEGKESYKHNRSLHDKDPLKQQYFSDKIDTLLRECQSEHSKGIPIGPDTSLMIAEIIGCTIDNELTIKLTKQKIKYLAYRYYDDYFLFFHSHSDAEKALAILQKILQEFELQANTEKTEIKKLPYSYESEWSIKLKSFNFRHTFDEQKKDIWNYFALAFKYASENTKDSVLKLALNKFNYVRIEPQNWEIFEALLVKVGLTEPATLQQISKILITYKSLITKKERIKGFIIELINQHSEVGHDYEITWALWIAKMFNINLSKNEFEKVINSNSVTATLVVLDLLQSKSFTINISKVEEKIASYSLTDKNWLLVYESILKGWITDAHNIVENSFFFKMLKDKNVFFYDINAKHEPLKVQRSYFKKISRKIEQVEKSLKKVQQKGLKLNKQLTENISKTKQLIEFAKQASSKTEVQEKLTATETQINELINQVQGIYAEQKESENRRLYWALTERLKELGILTVKEVNNQEKELLFDSDYL